jgi:AcrR family transcriptional regulator
MEESCEYKWSSGFLGAHELPRRNERRDAAEHRKRILETAQHLFAAHGVQAVSMHQIARGAGVGQGTLYRRYAHKGDLCMDLLREGHEQLEKDIVALLAANAPSSALARLDGVLTCLVTFFEEQGPLLEPVAATRNEWICDAPEQRTPPPYLWLYELLKRLLTEAVERGELVELDVAYTADAILATLHPMIYRFQRQERGFSQERILQGLRRIYIYGVKASNATVNTTTGNANSIP